MPAPVLCQDHTILGRKVTELKGSACSPVNWGQIPCLDLIVVYGRTMKRGGGCNVEQDLSKNKHTIMAAVMEPGKGNTYTW